MSAFRPKAGSPAPRLSRRAFVAGGLVALPFAAAAQAGGRRAFDILRGGEPFGTQSVSVHSGPDGAAEVTVQVSLVVKLLGVTAFRYTMENREVWKAGRLVSMESRTDDDGDADFARARAAGDLIEIEGSAFSGTVPGDAATTTYWTKAFLARPVWINTQTGVPIDVRAQPLGAGRVERPAGAIATERWSVKGDNLDVVLHYAGEEWASVEFDAGGEPAIYLPDALSPPLAPVWAASL